MRLLEGVDWTDLRRKAWHGAILAASAWVAVNPKHAWLTPIITHMAGQSVPIGMPGKPTP